VTIWVGWTAWWRMGVQDSALAHIATCVFPSCCLHVRGPCMVHVNEIMKEKEGTNDQFLRPLWTLVTRFKYLSCANTL
jgi:hypothetical protein